MLSQVRWLRVVVAAFVVEVGLAVIGVPLLLLIGDMVLMTAVPVLCVVVPFVVAGLRRASCRARGFCTEH